MEGNHVLAVLPQELKHLRGDPEDLLYCGSDLENGESSTLILMRRFRSYRCAPVRLYDLPPWEPGVDVSPLSQVHDSVAIGVVHLKDVADLLDLIKRVLVILKRLKPSLLT